MIDLIEKDGKTYRVDLEHDAGREAPWEEDGHGPVSEWTWRSKAPGERVLCSDHGSRLYYDFQEAVKIARKDGWDCKPYSATETAGQRAHKAATADYEHLRRYCENDWTYVTVVVTEEREDEDGYRYNGPTACLGGVENDAMDYIESDVVPELIEELRG